MPETRKDLGVKVTLGSRDQTGPGLRDAGRNLKQFQDQLNKTKKAAQALVTVGAKLAAMGAGLAALTIFPVKTAAQFEKAMSGVKAVTEGTTQDFKEMEKVAKELGATTKFTATEAAGGLRFLGMAGLSAKEAMDALAPSLTLAAAGELEVAEAADIATNVMSAMSIPVEGLTHVMDVLANTATSSNTNVRELSEAMKYVATEAATAGIDVDTLSAMLGELANNGKKGTVAGTALRGVILALSAVTPKAQKALDRLNVQIAKNEDGSVDYLTTLERLHDANIGLGDATDIFRRTAAGSAIAIAKGTDAIREQTEANKKADGVAKTMAETMQKNLGGAIINLSSAFEGLKIALGTPLLDPLKKAIDKLTDYVRVLREIVSEHPEATKVILAATGTIGGIAFVTGGLLTTTGLLALAVVNVVQAYQLLLATRVGSFIAELIFGFGGLTGAVNALTVAFAGLTAAQALTIAGMVVVSGYYLKRAIDAFGEWMGIIIENKAASAEWREEMGKHKDALKEEGKSIEEVTRLTYEQSIAYAKTLKEKIQYYTAAIAGQERIGKEAIKEKRILEALQIDYKILHDRMREIKPLEPIPDSVKKSFDDLTDGIKATQEQYEKFVAVHDKISAKVKSYADKVIAWNEKLLLSELTTQEQVDKLRDLNTEKHSEVLEKQKDAEKALSEFRKALNEKDFELAEDLAKKAKDLVIKAVDYSSSALSSIKSHFDAIISSAEKAYNKATREAEKYAKEIKKLEKEILDSKKSGEEILLEIKRKTMTEEEQWYDRKKEAEKDLSELKKLGREEDKETLRNALKLADETIAKYRDLIVEIQGEGDEASKTIEDTTRVAKRGIEAVLRVKKAIYAELLSAAKDAQEGAETEAERIKRELDEAVELREAIIEVKLEGLTAVEDALDKLEADIRTVKVKVETTKADGGPVHTFARGGRLPGESKKDSIPVRARPGEWFIRNEAAHFWEKVGGSNFMHGINDPLSKAGEKIRGALQGIQNFNLGGMVQSMLPGFAEGGTMAFDSSKLANALSKIESLASTSGVRSLELQNLGRLELGLGGRIYPILGEVRTLDQLKNAIEREQLVRSNF